MFDPTTTAPILIVIGAVALPLIIGATILGDRLIPQQLRIAILAGLLAAYLISGCSQPDSKPCEHDDQDQGENCG